MWTSSPGEQSLAKRVKPTISAYKILRGNSRRKHVRDIANKKQSTMHTYDEFLAQSESVTKAWLYILNNENVIRHCVERTVSKTEPYPVKAIH